MALPKSNGARVLVIAAVATLGLMAAVIGFNTVSAQNHEKNFGHVGMAERVLAVQANVARVEKIVTANQTELANLRSDLRLVLHLLGLEEESP